MSGASIAGLIQLVRKPNGTHMSAEILYILSPVVVGCTGSKWHEFSDDLALKPTLTYYMTHLVMFGRVSSAFNRRELW